MRAARAYGIRDVRVEDIPEPEVAPGMVKVKIAWAGICGSDLALFQSGPPPLDSPHPLLGEVGPKVLGHEFGGHVCEVGVGVVSVRVGDLVAVQPNVADGTCDACRRGEPNLCANYGFRGIHGSGGFAEFAVVPAEAVFALPAGTEPEVSALVESVAVAWHAARRVSQGPDASVLIVGGGPIGLGVLISLKAMGVDRILVSEPSPARRERASALGAEVVDPREVDVVGLVRSSSDGVDASFDAAGAGAASLEVALRSLRPGGTCIVVAAFHEKVAISPNAFLLGEKSITGSFAYTATDFQEVIEAIAEGRLDPRPLVSSRIDVGDVVEKGLDHLLGPGRETEVKVLVTSGAPGGTGLDRPSASTASQSIVHRTEKHTIDLDDNY